MQEDERLEEYVNLDEQKSLKMADFKAKFWDFIEGKCFVAAVLVLVAVIGFALGRISGLQEKREPVRVISASASSDLLSPPYIKEGTGQETAEVKGASTQTNSGSVVASKNGTKYHYPWCAGAGQISEKNKIYFDSTEAARAAGYTPAANCKGLK